MVKLLQYKQCLGTIALGDVVLAQKALVTMDGFSLKFVKII
jgi:hypothetical protein